MKAEIALNKIVRMARGEYEIRANHLITYYRSIYASIVLYAAAALEGALKQTKIRRMMNYSQRRALITATRAQKTALVEAIPVAAGVPPLDLEARRRAAKFFSKRGKDGRAEDILAGFDGDAKEQVLTE